MKWVQFQRILVGMMLKSGMKREVAVDVKSKSEKKFLFAVPCLSNSPASIGTATHKTRILRYVAENLQALLQKNQLHETLHPFGTLSSRRAW